MIYILICEREKYTRSRFNLTIKYGFNNKNKKTKTPTSCYIMIIMNVKIFFLKAMNVKI